MTPGRGAAEACRASLQQYVENPSAQAPKLGPEQARSLIDAFVRITPPEAADKIEFIVGRLSAEPRAASRKPGNLVLNWRRLMEVVPDVALAGAGAVTLPAWTLPLSALYIWNKLRQGTLEEFSPAEATVILALWKHRDGRNQISEEDGYAKTNELRAAVSLNPLTQKGYAKAVDRLARLSCLELENGIIWLREWVKVEYDP